MECRFCHNQDNFETFTSINENVKMFICSNCKCHNKQEKNIFNYDDGNSFWVDIKDPDGNFRDLTSDTERRFKIKNWYGNIPNYINSFKDPKVLDVGCGLGYLLSALETKFKFGIEPGSYACKFINKNYKDIKIFNNNFEYIDKINEDFDIITAYHVIEHVDDPNKFIKLLKSKMKKKSKLIFGTPLVGTLLSNYFGKYYRLYNDGHVILFNLNSLKKLMNENNFRIIKIEKPYFRTDYFNLKNIIRLFNNKKISPPFYGSIVTIYAENL
tara:strand:+ start:41 stop:850 length:810 start_codon:yes stop_codon:yes gene_type:complete